MDKDTLKLIFVGIGVVASLVFAVIEARRRRRRREARRLARENRGERREGPLVLPCADCGEVFPADERICPVCGLSRLKVRTARRDRAWRRETGLGHGGARLDMLNALQDTLPPGRRKSKRREQPDEE